MRCSFGPTHATTCGRLTPSIRIFIENSEPCPSTSQLSVAETTHSNTGACLFRLLLTAHGNCVIRPLAAVQLDCVWAGEHDHILHSLGRPLLIYVPAIILRHEIRAEPVPHFVVEAMPVRRMDYTQLLRVAVGYGILLGETD